jgi:hypothetical protein
VLAGGAQHVGAALLDRTLAEILAVEKEEIEGEELSTGSVSEIGRRLTVQAPQCHDRRFFNTT